MGWGIYLRPRANKEGKKDLFYRVTSVDGQFKKTIPHVKVKPEHFNKRTNQVNTKADNATIINEKLTETTTLLNKGWGLYESGTYDFNELKAFLAGAKPDLDLKSFIETTLRDSNTDQIFDGIKDAYGAAKKVLGREITFKDLNFNTTNKLILDWKERLRSATVKTYKYHWGLIVNAAYNKKFTAYKYEPIKKWQKKRDKTTVKGNPYVETVQPQDFTNAIDRATSIMHINGLGFWLLSFCTRGLYFSDFNDIHTKKFDQYIEHPKWGNSSVMHHYRHKTQEPMWIMIHEEVDLLRNLLRGWLEITHGYKINTKTNKPYLNSPTYILSRKYEDGWFFKEYNKSTWNTINKQLGKIGMQNFKTARKTFETVSLTISTTAEIRHRLLGHEVEGIKRHYQDWEWDELQEQVHEAHEMILNKFHVKDLIKKLINKADQILDRNGYNSKEFNNTWKCWDSLTIEAVTRPCEVIQ